MAESMAKAWAVTQAFELTWIYEVETEEEALESYNKELEDAVEYQPVGSVFAERINIKD